jgi:FkbM family methyltransferase
MGSFRTALTTKVAKIQHNNFGVENFDEHRFGKYVLEIPEQPSAKVSFLRQIWNIVKKIIRYDVKRNKIVLDELVDNVFKQLRPYEERLENLYKVIQPESRDLVVSLIAFRIFGFSKVKLPINNADYWKSIVIANGLKDGHETYDPHFLHFILDKFNLKPIGYDIKFFFSPVGVAIDFIAEQYSYKLNGKAVVEACMGDIVLDIGGCWGDTALYFAHKTGVNGKVFSFEFIPDNIKLHNINTDLNPILKERIIVVPKPVGDVSGQKIYYKDHGPGSKVEFHPFEEQTGTTETISIDDFVDQYSVSKVNFIKMDIEGAELSALKGAIKAITRFRPTLAIAIYHSMEDFVEIPQWINSLNLDYELFIGHYTIHAEETICFAKPRN